MSAPKSVNAEAAWGVQSGKLATATAGICGILTQSGHNPQYDYAGQGDVEHSCYAISRPTARKSYDEPSGVVHNWTVGGKLYPDLVPIILIGGGFTATSDNNRHVLAIGADEDQRYTTFSHLVKHSDNDLQRTLTGCRTGEFSLTAARSGITYTSSGFGIKEGQETITSDPDTNARLLPATANITVEIDGMSFTADCKTSVFTLKNELQTGDDEQKLTSFERDDIPIMSIDVTGSYTGLDITRDTYRRLHYGGVGRTSISQERPKGSVTTTFSSIGSSPFSFTYTIPAVQFNAGEFNANGSDSILFDLEWEMVDDTDGENPCQIAVVNNVESYY